MAYQLIIFGYDENNRLPMSSLTSGSAPSAVILECNPCTFSMLVIVSPSDVPPSTSALASASTAGYRAGPNPIPTDTKELYVLEFPTSADGLAWMLKYKDYLVGKTIHSVDKP